MAAFSPQVIFMWWKKKGYRKPFNGLAVRRAAVWLMTQLPTVLIKPAGQVLRNAPIVFPVKPSPALGHTDRHDVFSRAAAVPWLNWQSSWWWITIRGFWLWEQNHRDTTQHIPRYNDSCEGGVAQQKHEKFPISNLKEECHFGFNGAAWCCNPWGI